VLKEIRWLGSTRSDLRRFPEPVRLSVGHALYLAQLGEKAPHAKPLRGFGGASTLEVVESFDGDAYRAVYTVRFEEAVYVLHCFQKKSRRGIATPHAEIELIRRRLKQAEEIHRNRGMR
jgi:phage-related protein